MPGDTKTGLRAPSVPIGDILAAIRHCHCIGALGAFIKSQRRCILHTAYIIYGIWHVAYGILGQIGALGAGVVVLVATQGGGGNFLEADQRSTDLILRL
jgi:hypothetical protein